MNDREGKAILRQWPDTTSMFQLSSGRMFVKAFPPTPLTPLVVFGTVGPVTEADGAYVDVHPTSSPNEVPSVDVLFIETCGSSDSNLRDKRSRYLPVHEARGLAFPKAWFKKNLKCKGASKSKSAWETIGLTTQPKQTLHALIRAVRVLYVVPDATLKNLRSAEVPRGHEYFVSDSWFRLTVSGWPTSEPAGGWESYLHHHAAWTNHVRNQQLRRIFDLNQYFLS